MPPHNAKQPADRPVCYYHAGGDVFFFDYGVVVMWGLNTVQENNIIKIIEPSCVNALQRREIEVRPPAA